MKTFKIKWMLYLLFFGEINVVAQDTQSSENIPCEKCVVFKGLYEKARVNKYDNKTYYQYKYLNQCTEPVDMWWDCNGKKKRTLMPGKFQKIEGACGGGNGVQVIKIKCEI